MIDFPQDARGRALTLLLERAKYERFVASETAALLDREFRRIVDLLSGPKYRDLTQFQRTRALQLYREIERRIVAVYGDVTALHLTEFTGYAQLEAEVARQQVVSILAAGGGTVRVGLEVTLPRAFLQSIAALDIQGLPVGDWFSGQAQTMSRETRRVIQQGLIEGKGPAEIARRIMAPDRVMGPRLPAPLLRRARTEATIISRTSVNAVQNAATRASYRQLPPSVSDSWRFVAVRDARTTDVCVFLDGKVFRFDDDTAPYPPRHLNCRSGTIAVVKGATVSPAQQAALPLTMQSMSAWLTAQPSTTQNAMLGATRAGLFRDGRMQLADAIGADHRVLTLPQLRAKLGLDVPAPT